MITILTVLLFLGLLLFSTVLMAWLLRVIGRRFRANQATWGRSFAIALAGSGYQLLCLAIYTALPAAVAPGVLTAALLLQVPLTWLMIVYVFGLSWPRAMLTWLASTAVLTAASLLIVVFAVRPYLVEAYTTPANSMAPTILGNHITGVCPRCGAEAYGSPSELESHGYQPGADDSVLLICSRDLKPCHLKEVEPAIGPGDRIMVNKQVTPERWDMVVFRFPADPATPYVKRLVGLPGEEVVIRDGAIWIDGQRLDPPAELRGLEYVNKLEDDFGESLWGSPDRPAKLGLDEYFMLGDFSLRSSDSRVWHGGAPGHPTYAVPQSHLIGVVTHIYWPPSRQRAFK